MSVIACKEKQHSSTYLLAHPSLLISAWQDCSRGQALSPDEILYCEKIKKDEEMLQAAIEAQQIDPEQFGEHILLLETRCALAKAAYESARVAWATSNAEHASSEVLQRAQTVLLDTKAKYQALHAEVKISLAVVGLHSPE